MKKALLAVFGLFLKTVTLVLALSMLYLFLSLIFSFYTVNDLHLPAKEGIEIFVSDNGVHTDLILPVRTSAVNWENHLPYHQFSNVDSTYQFVSFGWGDRNFYMKTPTWKDLTFSTAFKALFIPSPSAMRVVYFNFKPTEDKKTKKITLSEEEYLRLVDYIKSSFQTDERTSSFVLIPGKGYSTNDNFYEANRKFHLFNTCNVWTNRGLKKTGLNMPVWTPFTFSIMNNLD